MKRRRRGDSWALLEEEVSGRSRRASATSSAESATRLLNVLRRRCKLTTTSEVANQEEGGRPLLESKIFCLKWLDNERVAFGDKAGALKLLNPLSCELEHVDLPVVQGESTCELQGGIHAIAVKDNLVLTAGVGDHAERVGVFEYPSFKPLTVSGTHHHTDWAFGVEWLISSRAVSVGRDGRVIIWKADTDHESASLDALNTAIVAECPRRMPQRIRSCSVFAGGKQFVTIASTGPADRCIRTWEVGEDMAVMIEKPSLSVGDFGSSCGKLSACVCAHNSNPSVFCFGWKDHVYVMDRRQNVKEAAVCVKTVDYSDDGPVRSLSLQEQFLTCGGASGTMFFYDIREASKPLPKTFRNRQAAVFCHDWDPTGTALAVAGGDLHVSGSSAFLDILL